ncbi:hypothetical protein N865_17970 [Intrasporangium oryzae NRRL B-24470]|uniref:Copper chaperone PCu(A)C n=1 Tax=Intrasporangium oryzae NRRL B-24470 TaxID=1386089 RepID=W9G443_9MICO|nr:copper chaperone PCu(A)C [Intrasporangium oryzae]EWT00067.1 hypothetical protein N865_17970 [Intrasporangium oryzae NRRL B-24470]
MSSTNLFFSRSGPTLVAVGLSLALAACGTITEAATPGAAAGSARSSVSPNHSLTLESGWAKAADGMTAVFGTVRNTSPQPVTIVGGTTEVARAVEVHTMVMNADGTMSMTVKKGGLVVPAGGAATLAPGGDHVMLLGLSRPLSNGEEITLRMRTADGDDLAWTVPVRSFAGADERYAPGHPTGGSATTGPRPATTTPTP